MKRSILDQTLEITVLSQEESGSVLKVKVLSESSVFEGHFPDNPILPGVVMVEAVRVSLGQLFQKDFRLQSALSIKFLAVLNPEECREVNLSIKHSEVGDGQKIDANLYLEEKVFFKMKAVYQVV